jgi:hypothetical protein
MRVCGGRPGAIDLTQAMRPQRGKCPICSQYIGVPLYHAARGCVCFCGCGHGGNAAACPPCPQPRRRRSPRARPPSAHGVPGLVKTPLVVKGDPFSDAEPGFVAVGAAREVNVLVLQRAPQPLDEHIVHAAAATVHGDGDAGFGERAGEGGRGELRALVNIEDLGLAKPCEGLLERRKAKRDVHRVRQAPCQHRPRRPVDDRHEIEKATPDRDVCDVGRPDVVRPLDPQR